MPAPLNQPLPQRITNVVILADQTLHREAWRALIAAQPHLEVIGAIEDAAAITKVTGPEQAIAILIDLPGGEARAAHELHQDVPEYGLLFLVDDYTLETILPILQAGGTGCLSRDESVPDLARALIATGRHEMVFPSAVAAQALAALASGVNVGDTVQAALTDREREVLTLLADGLTNKDIAQTLILSVRTVEAHLRNIYSKLAVQSRTEAALWAVRHGFGGQNR